MLSTAFSTLGYAHLIGIEDALCKRHDAHARARLFRASRGIYRILCCGISRISCRDADPRKGRDLWDHVPFYHLSRCLSECPWSRNSPSEIVEGHGA